MDAQELRDLKWAIGSPSLIESSSSVVVDADSDRIAGVDERDLLDFLDTHATQRVGHYFENLILYWLERIRRVELIAVRKQVRERGRTVGEVDFAFRDEHGRVTHLETAVKFYLHCRDSEIPDSLQQSHYIGPNAADTFERKMRTLFEKQLPLGKAVWSDVETSQVLVKGRIFYPLGDEVCSTSDHMGNLPVCLSDACLKGRWVRVRDLDLLKDTYGDSHFRVLQKPFWLAPLVLVGGAVELATWATFQAETRIHFEMSNRPILVCVLKSDSDSFQEIERLFVVSDDWPGLARDAASGQ